MLTLLSILWVGVVSSNAQISANLLGGITASKYATDESKDTLGFGFNGLLAGRAELLLDAQLSFLIDAGIGYNQRDNTFEGRVIRANHLSVRVGMSDTHSVNVLGGLYYNWQTNEIVPHARLELTPFDKVIWPKLNALLYFEGGVWNSLDKANKATAYGQVGIGLTFGKTTK